MEMETNTTLETLFLVFFVGIIVDFITGILVAAKQGKLKSRTCSNGMFRSIGECILFATFIFKEGLSIIENLVSLDVWIPESIKRMLSIYVDNVDNYDKNKTR